MHSDKIMFLNRLMIVLAMALVFLSVVGTGSPQAATRGVLERVLARGEIRCAYALWPPFSNKDPNTGELSGFNIDIMQAIGRELGLDITWSEEVGFGNYIEGLKTGRYDAMCQTVWPDPARLTQALVTIPAHYHRVHVVVRADDSRFDKGWDGLNDPAFAVATVDGDITHTIARTDFPKARIVALPQAADARQIFMEIATGKADATFVDLGFFNDYNRANPGTLKIVGNPLRVYGSVFSVPQGELEFKSLLDNALITLINNGEIAAILARHPTDALAPAPTYQPLRGAALPK